MQEEQEIIRNINKITTAIEENYPELIDFLNEMPQTIPIENSPKANKEALQKYYDNLLSFFRNYISEHQFQKTIKKNSNGIL
ncbi:MAG: hypothetical protein ACJAQ1_001480 [Flavobacterium sp.]|jgi:hypothetical protein